jgi:PadR family transcriptional regulator, regulatory protein PadR
MGKSQVSPSDSLSYDGTPLGLSIPAWAVGECVRFPLTIERSRASFFRTSKGEREVKERGDLLQGTLDMLVLKALQLEPMHGWGITERIEQWSEHVLQLGQGTLYPALYRLERQGLIQSEWKVTENSRRARYYSLTRDGRRQLTAELAQWRRTSRAINLVLDATIA